MLIMSQTGGEVAIPFATMLRAEQTQSGKWIVLDGNGDSHTFTAGDWNIAIRETPRAVLPAHPGTYLLHRNDDGKEPYYWKTAVLGWIVGLDAVVRPVTIDPEFLLLGQWTVRHPDGFIEAANGDSWDTIDHWLEATRS
ncbi:hypothetical protein [Sphingomonas sanguinis]|uniref:hypothetical protein n=1 Tax=Sphingomonas sanguinis TaxID=33051 RepID=UPI00128FAF51|nr:hypothetical protein [Sphingomonas sanguinis]